MTLNMARLREAQALLNSIGPVFGIRIIESPHCVTRERARKYPKRKAKSASHWARMDKKYVARFGFVTKPAMYMTTAFGGQQIICHPTLAARLRREIRLQTGEGAGHAD